MTGIRYVACLWALVITQTGCVRSDIQFLERQEGQSVVLPCAFERSGSEPYGMYLMRTRQTPYEVLFMYTKSDFHVKNDADKPRISVSGDPSSRCLNVTISQLTVSDSDRYYCEFTVAKDDGADERLPGKTEFFLLVNAEAPGLVDIGLVEVCAGGSAVLPCLPPSGDNSAVEGVSLRRQKGRAPVEVVYRSKGHHGSSPPSSPSQFPAKRVQLSSAPGPSGITYNLTLQQLQPEDSALYSCQLLLRGRPDSSTSLGTQVFFLSVQGGQCDCPSYSTLLYALSAAVAVLLILLFIGFVKSYRGKSRRNVKSHSQAPIYEEMSGLQNGSRKLAPHHLAEMEPSEYRNCPRKKSCPENHYESPSGALRPQEGGSDIKY